MSKDLKIARKVIMFLLRLCLIGILGYFTTARLKNKCTLEVTDIILLAFLIFLILADKISSFSVGNIISLKKDIKENKKAIEDIRNQIVSIASVSNTVVNNQYFGNNPQTVSDQNEIRKHKGVESTELKEKSSLRNSSKKTTFNLSASEEKCLEFYCKEKGLQIDSIDKSRKISFPNGKVIYCDGYYQNGMEENFIEIRPMEHVERTVDRIREYLSVIENFNRLGNRRAFLHCLIYAPENNVSTIHKINQIKETFSSLSNYLIVDFYFLDEKKA